MKRRQQDALLENIIKESLLIEDDKQYKRKTILKSAPKKNQSIAAKYGGIAYQVVIRGRKLTTGEINYIVYGKTVANRQVGQLSSPYNDGYVYIISTKADASNDEKFSYYVINVLVLPEQRLAQFKKPKQKTGFSKLGDIGNSIMINAESFANDYNVPTELIDVLEVKQKDKYAIRDLFKKSDSTSANQTSTPEQPENSNEPEETDVIEDVIDKKFKNGSTFTGKWNSTMNYAVSGIWTVPHPDGVIVKDGTWAFDKESKLNWLSQGIKTAPSGEFEKGTFDFNKLIDGEYYEIGSPYTDTDLGRVYRTWTGYKQGGKIDTTKQFKISVFDVSTKKEVSYYEGTVDETVKPNNGTIWEDSTKTNELGKITNGEWTAK
jgi:hypothetical protein